MTKKQIERLAQGLHEMAMATFIGAGADLIVASTRVTIDLIGISASYWLFAHSLRLTGKLGGPKI